MLQPPKAPKITACPTCFKTDKDDRANCANRAVGMCPRPRTVPSEGVVEVVCDAPCGGRHGKHLAIPLGNVMKRKHLTNLGQCAYDVCRARVIHTTPPPALLPPPLSEEMSETVEPSEPEEQVKAADDGAS